MPVFEGDLTKKNYQIHWVQNGGSLEHPNDNVKMFVYLKKDTSDADISSWSLQVVVNLLTIWKSQSRFPYSVENFTLVKSNRMLCEARDKMAEEGLPSIKVRSMYPHTISIKTEPWETDSYSMSEKIILLEKFEQII